MDGGKESAQPDKSHGASANGPIITLSRRIVNVNGRSLLKRE